MTTLEEQIRAVYKAELEMAWRHGEMIDRWPEPTEAQAESIARYGQTIATLADARETLRRLLMAERARRDLEAVIRIGEQESDDA